MRRLLALGLCCIAVSAAAQEKAPEKKVKDADLGKKGTVAVDKSLAGDITRKKEDRTAAPALQYDQFRLGVELQVASKRREQIESLKKIISLSPDQKEAPGLLFRLGELYWEESKFYFFEANRRDDDYIVAMNRKDKAGMERAKSEKEDLLKKSKDYSRLAVEQYSEIVQRYKNYERTDEVLYFLGHNLMEQGDDRKALVAYKRLVDKFPKSRYLPDVYLAFGEYYFNNSKGRREMLEKALENYKKAAGYPENQIYAFALYKQGWCYYNMSNYQKAMDMYKTVVLFGELAGASAVEKDGGKSGKHTLIREARADFVRAYAQIGSPTEARAEFGKVASKPDDRFLMMKQLANLYYEDGKDREAALTYNALIRERPLSPEAPMFQGKIVDCILRAGNKRMTVEQVRRLVKIMQDVENAKVVRDEKDAKALAEGHDLAERTLSNLAVNWHNEAKKTRDDETFGLSNEIYSDYLNLFPNNPKAYDLRFFWAELLNDNLQKYEKAAEEYTKVVMQDVKRIEGEKDESGNVKPGKPGKWLVNAAYNAVLAYDEVVKKAEQAGQIKTEPAGDVSKKMTIPPQKKALLEACERYLKYVPNGDKKVEIAFKAANLYYRHNEFDKAVERFSDIALNYPEYKFEDGSRAAEVSANLVLDSYNLQGNWPKVNEWARKFYANDKLATGKFREELSKVIEQSSFKLIRQLEDAKEYAKAADAYLHFVSEFPKSEIADKALFNASIDYFNAKMMDKAIETRQRIIDRYPKSEFVPACIYANAESHEAVGDFEQAATAYETYVRLYEKSLEKDGVATARKGKKGRRKAAREEPKPEVAKPGAGGFDSAKAQVALHNAGVFRDGLGQFQRALKDREHFLELWPDSKDAEAVFLSIADLYEKAGSFSKAVNQLDAYRQEHARDPNKVLMADGRIAKIYETKLRRPKEADRVNARIMKFYQELPSRLKKSLDPPALEAVAHAHLLRNEDDFRYYAAARLRWGHLPAPEREFKDGLKEKAKRLKVVQDNYTQTVGFKAGNPAICALYKIGQAYDLMVDALINAPMPRGSTPELQDAIREELSNQANPLKEKASEAYAAAVQKSRELDVHNDCAAKSLKTLRDNRPDQYPPLLEETAELRGVKPQVASGDLLASIQPIPVVTAAQQARNKERAAELKDEFKELELQLREPSQAAPPRRGGSASDVRPASHVEPRESKPEKRRKGGLEEPEDDL